MLVMVFCGEKDLSLQIVGFHHLSLTLSIELDSHNIITQNTFCLSFESQAGNDDWEKSFSSSVINGDKPITEDLLYGAITCKGCVRAKMARD